MTTALDPPKHLSTPSKALWKRLVVEYSFGAAELVTFQLALEAFDRCQEARKLIAANKTGALVYDRFNVPRAHPMVAVERDARIGFARLMRELGLDPAMAVPAEVRPLPLKHRYEGRA